MLHRLQTSIHPAVGGCRTAGARRRTPGQPALSLSKGPVPYNKDVSHTTRKTMPLSGEAIRLMNYIDDVAVTLRRILATIPILTPEERARVAEHLLNTHPSAQDVAEALVGRR